MIVVYTSPGCAGCRKLKQWLKDRDINYVEKNIFKVMLSPAEIKYLLSRTENGAEDIISKRSKIIQENNIDVEDMTVDELIHFIQQNPSVLKRPIILNEDNFQVGYDSEEITTFQKEALKNIPTDFCTGQCQNWDVCGKVRQPQVCDSEICDGCEEEENY